MTFKSDLQRDVKAIFSSEWKKRDGRVVPEPGDLSLGNDAVELDAAVLYADMADSTDLVDKYEASFAAEIYKAYLLCAARIIKSQKGVITAYDGDRVMAVFLGNDKETLAVRTAMQISYAVQEIINPLLKEQYPRKAYHLAHVIGIDASKLFAARTGVRNDNDLVWVGRAANYAAKLCSRNGEHPIYITKRIFEAMSEKTKYGGENHTLMWEKEAWTERKNMIIYGSKWWWEV